MAWVRLYTLGNYQTALQTKLLSLLDDDSVRKGMNEEIAKVIEPYVPKESGGIPSRNAGDYPGRLRESVLVTADAITWRTPYAHYVYAGEKYAVNYPIHDKGNPKGPPIAFYSSPAPKIPTGISLSYTTGGTGPHWLDLMLMTQRRTMNIRVTNYLKAECKRRGL